MDQSGQSNTQVPLKNLEISIFINNFHCLQVFQLNLGSFFIEKVKKEKLISMLLFKRLFNLKENLQRIATEFIEKSENGIILEQILCKLHEFKVKLKL